MTSIKVTLSGALMQINTKVCNIYDNPKIGGGWRFYAADIGENRSIPAHEFSIGRGCDILERCFT